MFSMSSAKRLSVPLKREPLPIDPDVRSAVWLAEHEPLPSVGQQGPSGGLAV